MSEDENRKEKLQTVGDELNLGEETIQTAKILFQQVTDEMDLLGLGIDNVLATILLMASKQNRLPVTISDIYEGWYDINSEDEIQESFSKKQMGRIERKFTEEFGFEIPPNQPDVLVNRYAEELGMPDEMSKTAQDILGDVLDAAPSVVTGGRAPSAIAATSLYLAAIVHDERLRYTQEKIGEVADTSEVTIRNRYPEFEEALGGEEQLIETYRSIEKKEDSNTGAKKEIERKNDREQKEISAEEDVPENMIEVTKIESQTFVFTGDIDGWTREEIRGAVEAAGGRTTESVSSKTDYLIAGSNPGDRKRQDADKHGIPKIDADQFLKNFEEDLPKGYEIDGLLYTIVENTISTSEYDSKKDLINNAVRSMLKRDIDGESLTPDTSNRENKEIIYVMLDDRLERFLDLLIGDNDSPFESESAFIETALREELGLGIGEATAQSVEISPDVTTAIENEINQSNEYESIEEFVHNAVLDQI